MNAILGNVLAERIPAAKAVSMSFPRTPRLLIDTTFATSNSHPRAFLSIFNKGWNLYLNLTELLSRQ